MDKSDWYGDSAVVRRYFCRVFRSSKRVYISEFAD